jgi:formylglycine-generating enzyme required for sulfatase activity
MTAEKLREAVVGPARARGFRFESDAMVERLVQSGLATPGALPLLQFALAELWEARDEELKILPASALDRIGGVEGALSRHADALLLTLRPDQREAARRILVRLVTSEGTRARRTATELDARWGPSAETLDALVAARLVFVRDVEGESTFELVHEALISGWGTLQDWLHAAAERRRLIQRLETAAAEWERLGFGTELLWHEKQLAETILLEKDLVGERETAFLEESRATIRRRKLGRVLVVASLPLVLLAAIAAAQLRTRQSLESEVGRHLRTGLEALRNGGDRAHEAKDAAEKALQLYDSGPRRAGEERQSGGTRWDAAERAWDHAREKRAEAEKELRVATQALETAVLLQPGRRDAHRALAETLWERIALAESFDRVLDGGELLAQLRAHDAEGAFAKQLEAPATVGLELDVPRARVQLERYETREGQLVPIRIDIPGKLPGQVSLPAGSYRLLIDAEHRASLRLPLLLSPGSEVRLTLVLPQAESVPRGFIYVPPGAYLTGVRGPEELRRALGAPPLHRVQTPGYLIGELEVTFGEWIKFLEDQPSELASSLRPRISAQQGSLSLSRVHDHWSLRMKPSAVIYEAREGDRINYLDREDHREQDWLRFPVLGVTLSQANTYAAWLSQRSSGFRFRLCNEEEWERAARGADGRPFALGERVDPSQANFDRTYGRRSGGFGPDEVGTRPASTSPSGVQDVQGNAAEIVTSRHDDADVIFKGGSWYLDAALDGHLGARLAFEANTSSLLVGMRLCADVRKEAQ